MAPPPGQEAANVWLWWAFAGIMFLWGAASIVLAIRYAAQRASRKLPAVLLRRDELVVGHCTSAARASALANRPAQALDVEQASFVQESVVPFADIQCVEVREYGQERWKARPERIVLRVKGKDGKDGGPTWSSGIEGQAVPPQFMESLLRVLSLRYETALGSFLPVVRKGTK
jgi:hypothetical protein